MVDQGLLTPQVMIWCEELSDWTAASQVPGLLTTVARQAATPRQPAGGAAADDLDTALIVAATGPRPWVMFIAVTAFVYAVLWVLSGFVAVVSGADKGIPLVVASGLFCIINGIVAAVAGILLINYANRLGSLNLTRSPRILESALDKLKAFWIFVSVVLIVALGFFLVFGIWGFAIASSVPRM